MSKTINTIKYGLVYLLIALALIALGTFTFIANVASAEEVGTYSTYNQQWTENEIRVSNPKPVVNSISPSSGNVGSGGKTVTITGSGFTPDSVARWNGSDRNTTFIDSSHLLIQLTSNDMNGSSGRYITVWNPSPGGGYSNASLFTINGYVAPGGTVSKPQTSTSNSYNSNSGSNSNSNSNNGGQVQGAQNGSLPSSNESYSSLTSNAIYGSNSFLPSGIIQWLLFIIFILLVVIVIRKIFFADNYHRAPLKHS